MREEKLKQYYDRKHSAEAGGGPDKVESQHSKGKLNCERAHKSFIRSKYIY